MSKLNWSHYQEATKGSAPASLLMKALQHVPQTGQVLDIGAGGLRDSRFLLAQGFEVYAMDREPSFANLAFEIKNDAFEYVVCNVERFAFPKQRYVLVNAQYVLPYVRKEELPRVLIDVEQSLVPGGVFCGQLFGLRDAWKDQPTISAYPAAKIRELFRPFEDVDIDEKEFDRETAMGSPKHWHVYNMIAKTSTS
ncbi:methyltransferase domain-containing protein [Candidatus Uhrbacteria bacterium]|nr:methyltransferase domain-containing protein [Candidatus Uhrbacteria bacterium]MBD3284421.1 methyltransferase domain-containing protein [Candidatus Uhrbacteria bacterium]